MCQNAEWDAQRRIVRQNAKWGVQGCGNGRGLWIMQLVGTAMHGDAVWDLGVIVGESSRLRRLWAFSGYDVEWTVVPMITGTQCGMVMSWNTMWMGGGGATRWLLASGGR